MTGDGVTSGRPVHGILPGITLLTIIPGTIRIGTTIRGIAPHGHGAITMTLGITGTVLGDSTMEVDGAIVLM